MSALDPRIEVIREKYGLSKDDFWELPQKKGTWIAKHAALEVAAAKANIVFDNPTIIQADTEAGIAVLSVSGSVGLYGAATPPRKEWATGEASPKNNKNAYPWAMAEKRAKDRVILKLIGIHGLVYSEDEGDFNDDATQPKAKTRDLFKEMVAELDACQSLADLATLWNSPAFKAEFAKLKDDWKQLLTEHKDVLKSEFKPATRGPAPDFDHLEERAE